MKDLFHSDVSKEKLLHPLLDSYYLKLKNYKVTRVYDHRQQHLGVDVIFTHSATGKQYLVDEKAQIDYINEDLPTFAFEIEYTLNGQQKRGWFFDAKKETEFYVLATGIFSDEKGKFTYCKLLIVNRKKLTESLKNRNIGYKALTHLKSKYTLDHGKITVPNLNPIKEGYLFWSKRNKKEQPLNLILKLQWLIDLKVAKPLG